MEFYGAEAHCIPYEEVTTSPPKFQEMLSITAYREKVHGEPEPIPMPEQRLEATSICLDRWYILHENIRPIYFRWMLAP